jgi:hypothetical protein
MPFRFSLRTVLLFDEQSHLLELTTALVSHSPRDRSAVFASNLQLPKESERHTHAKDIGVDAQ